MFVHSVKVPRLYKLAAKLLKEVTEGKGSVKQLVYEIKHPNIKAIYALVVETLQRRPILDNLLRKSKLVEKEPRLDPLLARILITELLWGKKRLTGNSKPVEIVLAYEQIFKAHLADVDDAKQPCPVVKKPRYVRINTLKISTNEVVDGFRDEGWIFAPPHPNYESFLVKLSTLSQEEFTVDFHMDNLLIFPPKTHFYKHPAYKDSQIILQDKASCLAVHVLQATPGSIVMDMCAAPGMKTTQLAAVVQNSGTVYAVELNQERFQVLNKMVDGSGATCVKTINKDVLTLCENDCPGVEYVLVDPSCSGSGIADRLELSNSDAPPSADRLKRLAGFQIKILRHALTRFSTAKRVVYSTCSVHPEENEDVVRQVLETCCTFKLVPAQKYVKDDWLNCGRPDYGGIGEMCLYAKPEVDLCNGFFIAVFERLGNGETNQFFNKNLIRFQRKMDKKATQTKVDTEKVRKTTEQQIKKYQKTHMQTTDEAVACCKKTTAELLSNLGLDHHIDKEDKKHRKQNHSDEASANSDGEENMKKEHKIRGDQQPAGNETLKKKKDKKVDRSGPGESDPKSKIKKKGKLNENEREMKDNQETHKIDESQGNKKKRHKISDAAHIEDQQQENETLNKKKKRKKVNQDENETEINDYQKRHKKHKIDNDYSDNDSALAYSTDATFKKKKKKKIKLQNDC